MAKRAFGGVGILALLGLLVLSSLAVPAIAEPPPTVNVRDVTPRQGRPPGGEVFRIRGSGFQSPLRVLFDIGNGVTIEAYVVSANYSEIDVLTPPVRITPPAQRLNASIRLISDAGRPSETRVNAGDFLFVNESLTPSILTAVPQRGPFGGGRRVTIFGEGFQSPVQVLFGSEEAQVVSVQFSEVIVISPASKNIGTVPIRVLNVNSNTSARLDDGYRYEPNLMIHRIQPASGPVSGGTSVTIEGEGFDSPLVVSTAGVVAAVLRATPTTVTALTSAARTNECVEVTGPVIVTNILNGDTATGPAFTYVPARPVITRVEPKTGAPGDRVHITIAGVERGRARFVIGQHSVLPISVRTVDGGDEYELVLPAVDAPSVPCAGGNGDARRVPVVFADLLVTNSENRCGTTRERALTIRTPGDRCGQGSLDPTP